MIDLARAVRLAGAIATSLVLTFATVPGSVQAGIEPVDESVPTEPETTEPATTEPEPEPTAPPSSEPAASTPAVTGIDDSIDTTAAVVGVIGFVALVAVAAWWMVRRRDEDDAPHPRGLARDGPLPGQDLF